MTQRAGRNRTLSVSPEEYAELIRSLNTSVRAADFLSGAGQIVNSDLFRVLNTIPDACADLIIIDPPYNLTKTFGDVTFIQRSEEEYEAWLRTWFSRVCTKLKPDGSLYMCGDWKCSSSMQRVISENMVIMNRITWQREKGRGASGNWKNSMEDIWFAVKNPDDYHFDLDSVKIKRRVRAPYKEEGVPKGWKETAEGRFRLTCPSNFWDDISVPFWSMPENTDHPTQKPEKLIAKLILASSAPGDLVFDPFSGSGTTAVTAAKLGRRYLAVELEEQYCVWALKRLRQAEHNKTIQGYDGMCFWERNTMNEQRSSKQHKTINQS